MKTFNIVALLALHLTLSQAGWVEAQQPIGNFSSLYEDVFRGSREVHVPKKLLILSAEADKIASIALSNRDPFRTERIQGMYFYPRLTNEDELYLYFDPYYGGGPLRLSSSSTAEVPKEAFRYNKKARKIETESVQDMGEYLREKIFGFYRHLENQSDGVMRISVERNLGYIAEGGKEKAWDIMNPWDIDSGADRIFLSRFQHIESDLPYMGSDGNIEFLVYLGTEKSIASRFTLPFTGSYLPIMDAGTALQSVVGQNLVYFILNSGGLDMPTLTVPKSPRRWHVLIYDMKEDMLYSVWHGMNESDGLRDLSFSYYLGREGLYFEVLKQGKIEIYLLDIDLAKAKPLKEYETVDLLWNNKRLKEQWEQKIQEAKSENPLFEERWE